MAVVPGNVQQGENWAGLLRAGDIPEPLRKRGIDELGSLAYIFRGHTRFLNSMIQEFPKPSMVADREYKTIEITEYDRVFRVLGASQAADNDTIIGISNDQAVQLEINDMLILKNTLSNPVFVDLNASQVNDAGTHVGPVIQNDISVNVTNVTFARDKGIVNNTYFYDYETVLLVDKGQPDSGGAGITNITLKRCYHGGGRTDKGGSIISRSVVNAAIAADRANAAIQVGDEMIRLLPNWAEGSSYGDGFWKAPSVDNNFTQEFKFAWSMTHESELAKSFNKEDAIAIKRRLHARRMMLDIERTILFGRKGKEVDAAGKERYSMGGVVEHIPKDADHVIRHSAPDIDYTSLLDVGERVFALGGGEKRTLYMSYKLYTRFKKAFFNHSAFRFNKEQTAKFDVPVESLIVTGGEFDLVPLYCMEEAGYTNQAIAIDWSVPCYQPVSHKGWDMKVEKDIGPRDTSIYKEGVVGMKGLRRRYAQYQSIIEFV